VDRRPPGHHRFSLNEGAFFDQFAKSMVKMNRMDVLTGTQVEIRHKKVSSIADEDEGLAAEM
jgi:hypothetical protein